MTRAARNQRVVTSSVTVGPFTTRLLSVPGKGTPIVLLHGFSDSADSWRPLLRHLALAGRYAVAIDFPGFGKATAIPRGSLLPVYDRFVADLVQLIGAGDPVVLVGNSMGGVVTLRAAADPRIPLLAVAALSPAGLGFHAQMKSIDRNVARLLPILRLAYKVPYPRWTVQTWATGFYHLRLADKASLTLARRYGAHFQGMADFRRIGALGSQLSREISEGDCYRLDRITRPVLLVWGTEDRVCDIAGADLVIDAVAESRLVVLDGAGHMPQLQRPAEVARLIADLPTSARRR